MRLLRFCIIARAFIPYVNLLVITAGTQIQRVNSLAIIRPIQLRSSATTPARCIRYRISLRNDNLCDYYTRYPTLLRNDNLRDEIEQAAQRRAYENRTRGGGTGETVGGAILGGLLGGPFGALFGAQIGASFGAASQIDKARKDEMKRKGLSPEMLDQATEIGVALKQAVEGLQAIQESVDTSQRLAKSLDRQEQSLYERAKSAIETGDDEGARKLLLERESVKEKLVKILKSVAEERKRAAIMESNVEALEMRGLEIEQLLRRSVGASSMQNSADIGFSLEREDPLLQKFRDLGM